MTDASSTNPTLQHHLNASGWFPGRQRDVAPATRLLQSAGFEPFSQATEFLAEFDGLTISFPNPRNLSFTNAYSFGSSMRIELVAQPWVTHWATSAQDAMCPVGTDDRGYGTLLAGASGTFYFGYDVYLSKIARTPADFIERLITGESWQQLKVDVPYAPRPSAKPDSSRTDRPSTQP